jgi:flagellar hook-associated protein 3 FlgL
MRVTNINLTDKLLRNIQDAQKAQLEAQEQVATNQKITKPSDDGVKFGRVTKLESEKRELIQYRRNNGHAEDIINASILNLEKLQELNVRAMEIARIGASGVNQNSYSAYVEEVDQLLE